MVSCSGWHASLLMFFMACCAEPRNRFPRTPQLASWNWICSASCTRAVCCSWLSKHWHCGATCRVSTVWKVGSTVVFGSRIPIDGSVTHVISLTVIYPKEKPWFTQSYSYWIYDLFILGGHIRGVSMWWFKYGGWTPCRGQARCFVRGFVGIKIYHTEGDISGYSGKWCVYISISID